MTSFLRQAPGGENHAKTLHTYEKREKHKILKVKVQSPVQSPVQCLQYALFC